MLVGVGLVTVGAAIAAARRAAAERGELEAFAREQGWAFDAGDGRRPFRMWGAWKGVQVRLTRESHAEGKEVRRRFQIETEAPIGLPSGTLAVRRKVPLPGIGRAGSLYLKHESLEEGRALELMTGFVDWLEAVTLRMPELRVSSGRLWLPSHRSIASIMLDVDQMVDAARELDEALRWRPTREAVKLLPPPGVPGLVLVGFAPPEPPVPKRKTPRAVPPSGPLGSMLASLAAGGERESEGHFTLDEGKALEKLRRARLDRKAAYVLDLVRAGVAREAKELDIQWDDQDLIITFDGAPFEAEELESLGASVFGGGNDDRVWSRRHLALGLQGALGNDVREVEVVSRNHRLVLAPGDEIGRVERHSSAIAHTAIRVRSTLRGRFSRVHAPVIAVLDRARWLSETWIRRGQRQLSRSPRAIIRLGRMLLEREDFVAMSGFSGQPDDEGAVVYFGQHGLILGEHRFSDAAPGFRVIFMLRDPPTDLSGTRLVDGPEIARLMLIAKEALGWSFQALADELARADAPHQEEARRFALSILHRLPTRAALQESVAAPLSEAPVWPLTTGDRVSSELLFRRFERVGRVEFAHPERGQPLPEGTAVVDASRLSILDRVLLTAWFGGAKEQS